MKNLLKEGEYVRTENEKELDAVLQLHYAEGVTFPNGTQHGSDYIMDSLNFPIFIHYGYLELTGEISFFIRNNCDKLGSYTERPISDFLKPVKMLFWDKNKEIGSELYLCGIVQGAASPFLSVNRNDEEKFLNGEKFDFDSWKNRSFLPKSNTLQDVTAIVEKMGDFTIEQKDGVVILTPMK